MEKLLIGIPLLLLTATSWGKISMPKEKVDGVYNFSLTGEDANILRSVMGTRKFKAENKGIKAVDCDDSKCLINADTSYLPKTEAADGVRSRAGGDAYTLDGDRVITNYNYVNYFADLSHVTGEKYFVSPSASMYYHSRDEVLASDKKLFKKLKRSKSQHVKKGKNIKGTTYSLSGENFQMSCIEYDDPKEYKLGGGGHGFSLPDFLRKTIDIEYSCRTYIKAMVEKLDKPFVVNTSNIEVRVLELAKNNELIPSKGIKVKMKLVEKTGYITDNLAQLITDTDDSGIARVNENLVLTHSNEAPSSFALYTTADTNSYMSARANLKDCSKRVDLSKYVRVIGVGQNTGKILALEDNDNICGSAYPGIRVLDNRSPSIGERRTYSGDSHDVQCVIVGTEFPLSNYAASEKYGWTSDKTKEYESREHHISEVESFESGIERAREYCHSSL